MAHLLEHLVFKGTPKHPNIPQELHGARRAPERHDLDRSHQLLRDVPAPPTRTSSGRSTSRPIAWSTRTSPGRTSRQRDDGRAQRVRGWARTIRSASLLQRVDGDRLSLAQLRQDRPSARGRTSRTCRSIACRRSTRSTTSRTTRCWWWPGSSTNAKTLRARRTSIGRRSRSRRAALERTYTVEPAQDGERVGDAAARRRHADRRSPSITCRPVRTRTSPPSTSSPRCSATRRRAGCTRRWSSRRKRCRRSAACAQWREAGAGDLRGGGAQDGVPRRRRATTLLATIEAAERRRRPRRKKSSAPGPSSCKADRIST